MTCVSLLAAASLAFPVAQGTKLNGPLALRPQGTLAASVTTSPDGQRSVYSGDRDGDGVEELWALAASGKEAPVLLAADASGGWILPDGDLVVHAVGDARFGARELAVVPIDASAPSRSLTGPIPAHATLSQYGTTADGAQLVYLVDQDSDDVVELRAAPIAGGPPVKLSGPLVPGGDVLGFLLAPRAPLVLYLADQDADEVVELYVVPADGSQPARKLPIPLVAGGDASPVDFDPSHVIYLADQEEDERFELYRIATDGSGAPEKLSATLVPGGDVATGYPYSFATTTYDRSRILYTADQEVDELFELYSLPADGSAPPVKLCSLSDQGLIPSGQSWDSRWWLLQEEDGLELHSVPTDGSGPLRPLGGAVVPGGAPFFAQITRDSQRVVFVSDQESEEVYELFGVPLDGSAAPVKLSGPMTPDGDVALDRRFLLPGFWIMRDGIAYEADQEVDGVNELYFASLDGSVPARKLAAAPVRVGSAFPSYAPFVPGTPLRDFGRVVFAREAELWSVETLPVPQPIRLDRPDAVDVAAGIGAYHVTPDGARVVYQAQEEGDRVGRFYSVPPDKLSEKIALVPDLLPGEGFGISRLTPDGTRLVFSARRFPGPRMQIFSVAAAGGEAPRVLGPSLASGELTGSFQLTPDGTRVLFTAGGGGGSALYVAPVDASSPALLLASLATPILDERINAAGTRVAFRSDQRAWSVALDGSAPAVQVSRGARPVLGDLQLTADGALVVYRTVGSATAKSELFAAVSDGMLQPLRLSVIVPNEGDVTAFGVAADGSRAVYRADGQVDGRFELFSVPLDGSAPPVRLHPALGATRDAEDFQIAPDSQRVVFRSDVRTDNLLELFSAPLDGSAPPVRLSVDLLPGGGVGAFRIAPDSGRVVYRAGGFSQTPALFSTPIRGPRGGVRLSGELQAGNAFEISADGRTVAFTSVQAPFAFGLHAVPLAGGQKATALAGPAVLDFVLSADGSRVVYRGVHDDPGVIELYATAYEPPHPPAQRR